MCLKVELSIKHACSDGMLLAGAGLSTHVYVDDVSSASQAYCKAIFPYACTVHSTPEALSGGDSIYDGERTRKERN